MEDVLNNNFRQIVQNTLPDRQIKICVTKFQLQPPDETFKNAAFEIWIEYTIPKDKGVVIGSNIYILNFDGQAILKNCFGTQFLPKT